MSHTIKKTKKGADITLTRGDSLFLQLALTKNDEPYEPAVGSEVRFAMKENYEDQEVVLEIAIPIDTLILEFRPEHTKSLPMGASYVYDIQLTDEVGHVDTFYEGTFKLDNEVE